MVLEFVVQLALVRPLSGYPGSFFEQPIEWVIACQEHPLRGEELALWRTILVTTPLLWLPLGFRHDDGGVSASKGA